jgi:hypothetical protein
MQVRGRIALPRPDQNHDARKQQRRSIRHPALAQEISALDDPQSHMLTEQPRLFFMQFWCVGSPQSVGAGIQAALSKVSVK